jgi:TolB-like protein/DNA-binding winged helix-turn-helix (wHTH) protein/Tfp pilus assembly protein PilF
MGGTERVKWGDKMLARGNSVFRFGPYELRTDSQEFRKHGTRLKLRGQPFLVLVTLLERAGEVVTRDEIRERIWASDTFVDFEHGLNTSIKKVRQVLCDSATEPRYIETLPRLGYRFIAPVESSPAKEAATQATEVEPAERSAEKLPAFADSGKEPAANGNGAPAKPTRNKLVPWPLSVAFALLTGAVLVASVGSIGGVRSIYDRLHKDAGRPKTYNSLAVLPLQSLSGDTGQEYFADGITDEIITNFAQVGDLRVISRTSAMRYKNATEPARQIGKDLGADALVEGTVERVGTRVRVRVQLIDAASDRYLWAKVYDRELSDVLILESSIAYDIVEQTRGQMSAQAAFHSAAGPRAVNPKAYELYLQGRYFWSKRSSEALSKSIDLFQQAVALDPKMAVAYAGLADAYSILGSDVLPVEVAQQRARQAANTAIALDPSVAEGHAAKALVAFYYDWDWKTAGTEFETALRLNPNYAVAHQWYSYYLEAMERFPDALREAQRAQELDPLSLSINTTLASKYVSSQQYDQAIAISKRVLEMDPSFVPAHRCLASVYEGKKMWPEAIDELKQEVDLSQQSARALGDLAYGLGLKGNRKDALKIVQTLEDLSARKFVSAFEVAKVFAALHDYPNALLYLEKSYRQRESQIPFLNVTTTLYPLHSDPQFIALVKRVGLPGS